MALGEGGHADIYVKYVELRDKAGYDPLAMQQLDGLMNWSAEYIKSIVLEDDKLRKNAEKALEMTLTGLRAYLTETLKLNADFLPAEAGAWCGRLVFNSFRKFTNS